ncbi:ras-related and estrogen-regulated growth inhibitor-like [Babylonia areolata]|uniref:ras-related and estrogen-regulated growth inhibitor-like n=1 Tax=Babylonia areolata TaxID=304850 RepID=UPI003FD6520F
MAYNGSRLRLSNGSDSSKDSTCKMVILGCPGVGKTALTVRYLTRRFIGEYCPTLESVYKYQTVIDDDDVRLEILDTAGQGRYPWKDGYALWGDCFLFVYSITDRDSFQQLVRMKRHVERVRAASTSNVIGILVANKNDLLHDRQVTEEEGDELADELGCRFYEVSASDGAQLDSIAAMFQDLYRDFRRSRQQRETRQRKASSSAKFRQAIQKVISGKTPSRRSASSSSSSS